MLRCPLQSCADWKQEGLFVLLQAPAGGWLLHCTAHTRRQVGSMWAWFFPW